MERACRQARRRGPCYRGPRRGNYARRGLGAGSTATDIYSAQAGELAKLRDAFPLQPGQSGAVLASGGVFCLDYVSQPEAFARLYPKLLDGYLLDALQQLDDEPVDKIDPFVAAVTTAHRSRRPSVALGEDVRLRGVGVVGCGLELEGELIQLSAFSSKGGARPGTRIPRPIPRS